MVWPYPSYLVRPLSPHPLTCVAVLVNNAGVLQRTPEIDLPPSTLRTTYNDIFNINLTSVAVVTTVFQSLLYKSAEPKVISVTSGLGSIQNVLTKKLGRSVPYGASKIGLNGLMVHMQVAENDRVEAEANAIASPSGKPKIRYYVCAPGVLKTSFTQFWPQAKEPAAGAEVIYHLLADDDKTYEGGSYWEYEHGEMRKVPW